MSVTNRNLLGVNLLSCQLGDTATAQPARKIAYEILHHPEAFTAQTVAAAEHIKGDGNMPKSSW